MCIRDRSYISSIDVPSLYEDGYDSDDTWEYSSIEQSIEKKYTEYASRHYGSYNAPELEKYKKLVQKYFKGYYSADREGDLLWAVNGVAELLAENTSYSLKLARVPAGQDYAEYFLFGQKKGYCEHYATAATILPFSYTHLDVYKRQFQWRTGQSYHCGYDNRTFSRSSGLCR